MKLKDLERDLQIMEASLEKMENINRNVETLDGQVQIVKKDLIKELKNMNEQADRA